MYQFNRKEYEERMKWYQDARFGMFIHWGLYSTPARARPPIIAPHVGVIKLTNPLAATNVIIVPSTL